jgi:hypothetical protein
MVLVLAKHGCGMPLVGDEDAVEELASDAADEAFITGLSVVITASALAPCRALTSAASLRRMRCTAALLGLISSFLSGK